MSSNIKWTKHYGQKTLEELDKMTTERLLKYYRSIRWSYRANDAPSDQHKYVQMVKTVLAERENVPLKRGGVKVTHKTKDPVLKDQRKLKYDPFNGVFDMSIFNVRNKENNES